MRKNVFTKYIAAFVIIIFVSFTILTVINNSVIRNFSIKTKQEDAEHTATIASKVLGNYYRTDESDQPFSQYINAHPSFVEKMLSDILGNSDERVLIVTDTDGAVLLIVAGEDKEMGEESVTQIPKDIMALLLVSENGTVMMNDTMGGIFRHDRVTNGKVIRDKKDQAVGAVFSSESLAVQGRMVATVNRTIFTASLWVMLASIIAVYFISDRIVNPLRSMTKTVKAYGNGNRKARVTVTGQDEIAELGNAFNHMADSIEQTEIMRNAFLANVSHDLRTPMTTISGFVDGMLSGTIPPEKHGEYLEIVSSETHRLSRLVAQLLDISKLESGERKFSLTKFDICEMARLILISFEQKIEDKQLEIQFDCTMDSMFVYSDKDAVHQVLYNLIDNAQKFAKQDGVLRVAIHSKDIGKVSVSVYNEGAGIPEEDEPYVFDRFYKSDKSRGLDKTGTGLGLYIAKTILESLHEEIKLHNEAGKSCEFVFTLTEDRT